MSGVIGGSSASSIFFTDTEWESLPNFYGLKNDMNLVLWGLSNLPWLAATLTLSISFIQFGMPEWALLAT